MIVNFITNHPLGMFFVLLATGIIFILLLMYFDARKEFRSGKLTDTLTNMHKRMMYFQEDRLRRVKRIDKQGFNTMIPILFDKLGLVEIGNWDKFKNKLGSSIKKQIPKSPEKRRQINWYFKVISKASKVRAELLNTREWDMKDAVEVGSWLDKQHIGIGERRHTDKSNWQKDYDSIKPYVLDERLSQLIYKHIDYSYSACSIALFSGYADRLANNIYYKLLRASLDDSAINALKIDAELSKILRDVEARLKILQKRNKLK